MAVAVSFVFRLLQKERGGRSHVFDSPGGAPLFPDGVTMTHIQTPILSQRPVRVQGALRARGL